MYAVVIGASEEAVFAIKEAQSMGMKVVAFDGNKDAIGLKYADESFVVDIRKPENVYRILNNKKITKNELVIIPVPIGRFLITSGAVNERYNLCGVKEEACNICTDKFLFHQTLKKVNLRNIECYLLSQGHKPQNRPVFPVVVKPRFGAGSRAVSKILDEPTWQEFVKNTPYSEDFIIEEAINGAEYGLDGMVINEILHVVLLRKKIITSPPVCQCVGYYSILENSSNKELIERIRKYIQLVVEKIGITDGIIHADIIDDGKTPFVIELSARPSGHNLHNLFTPKVTGINMIREFLEYAIKGECIFTRQEQVKKSDIPYMIHFFDMGDCYIKKIPDISTLKCQYPLEEYECNLELGYLGKVVDGHSLMGRGYFILKGENETLLKRYSDEIINAYL